MEQLFKGYYRKDNTVAFTGYTLPSIIASFSPDDILGMHICLWTGLKDWRFENIYADNILNYWWPKKDKGFTGVVRYEAQLGRWIVEGIKPDGKITYIELTDSGMSGGIGEDGEIFNKLDSAEIVGNIYQSAFKLNSEQDLKESDTTEVEKSGEAGSKTPNPKTTEQ